VYKWYVCAEIQSLVLGGRLGEAIQTTQQFYPDLLKDNMELLFVLRCRQFIEIVNGTEGESVPVDCSVPCARRPQHVLSASQLDSATTFASVTTASPASQRSCQLTASSQTLPTADTDRLTNGTPLNLSASFTDKNILAQNGEAHSANDGDMLGEQDSDMDTSDNEERTLANGSSAQCCVNGSSQLPKYGNLTTTFFDSESGDDDNDVNLETVMGKNY